MQEYTSEEVDAGFELLAQHERRCIILFLRESEADWVSISEIAESLRKSDTAQGDSAEILVSLYHNHLPKLARRDVVDFDPSSETVRYRGDALVETIFETTSKAQIPHC